MEIIYKGYSSHIFDGQQHSFSLTGVELVNMDILSHLYTDRGERVMMPSFGTYISSAAFEPLTEHLISKLRDDIETVIDYDPRVEKIRIVLTPYYDSSSVVASVTMRYVELNIVDDLNFVINIDKGNDPT